METKRLITPNDIFQIRSSQEEEQRLIEQEKYIEQFWNTYQEVSKSFCGLRCKNMSYFIIGLSGEAFEVSELDSNVLLETGDCLWFVSQFISFIDESVYSFIKQARCDKILFDNNRDINAITGKISEIYKKVLRADQEPESVISKLQPLIVEYIRQLMFIIVKRDMSISLEEAAMANIYKLNKKDIIPTSIADSCYYKLNEKYILLK